MIINDENLISMLAPLDMHVVVDTVQYFPLIL